MYGKARILISYRWFSYLMWSVATRRVIRHILVLWDSTENLFVKIGFRMTDSLTRLLTPEERELKPCLLEVEIRKRTVADLESPIQEMRLVCGINHDSMPLVIPAGALPPCRSW
jgi:hypothetical protein